jgi:hypothetical protein
MAIPASDRPLEALRDEVVDRLVVGYGDGRLSLEAFQRRLDDAYDADRHDALSALVADLGDPVGAAPTDRPRQPAQAPDEDGISENLVAVFGGCERKGQWAVPSDLHVITVFGGAELDFSEATFTSATTRIRVLCLFGGVDIRVPEGVRVTVNAVAIFGAAGSRAPACDDPAAPRLVVEGLVMFGAAEAKLKRPSKQGALERAARLRGRMERPR